jgi:DNA polymerase I-like protein with 3'-5' exonuclease and polymerase domains
VTFTPPNGERKSAADAARHCLRFGVYTTPVMPHGKKPFNFATGRLRTEWEQLRVAEAEIDALFPEGSNVGLLLGEPSGGLVDGDLDCPEARLAAPFLLPKTGMVGGRESAPDSHRFYVVNDPPKKAAEKYLDPCVADRSDGLLLELRSTGGQTVVAPSVYGAEPEKGHPKPEPFVWSKHGEPARVNVKVLQTAVRATAAAALVGRYWPKRARHDAALALAGALRRAGWLEEPTVKFVRAVCAAAQDEEPGDRERAVRDTFAKVDGEQMTGWPTLAKLMGDRGDAVVGAAVGWLGIAFADRGPRATFGGGRGYEQSPVTPERYEPLPDYEPFPTDCLPAPWDTFVREGAAALRCDEGMVGLPLLSVLAGAIGNTRRVYLGAEWFEPAVIWSCIVAESGSLKSPAAELSTDLVQTRQKALVKDFREQVKQYKQALREYKQQSAEGGEQGEPPTEPTLKRVLAGDTTIEKLVGLLDDNPRGLLVYRDELAGWVNSFTRYKSGGASDEANWLSMHRAGPVLYDRKTGNKTTVFVSHAAVSVTGGIQPCTLKRLMTTNFFESGLVARILFVMPPRTPKRWTDQRISDATKEAARRSLDGLFDLAPEQDEDGDPMPVVVKLAPDAQRRLKAFVDEWGKQQFEAEGARAAALAKLEAVPGRFALLHHTVKHAGTLDDTQPIEVESIEAGIRLAKWAARETDRVYSMLAETETNKETRQLVERVRRIAEKNKGRLTANLLQRSYQRKYKTADLAKADLERLVSMGLGEWEPAPPRATGGWTPTYFIPRAPSEVMGDTSYSRPSEGDDPPPPEGDDTRPDRPEGDPPPPQPPPRGGAGQQTSCGSTAGTTGDREYEASPITHEAGDVDSPPGPQAGGDVENHHDPESSVTHPAVVLTAPDEVRHLADAVSRWEGAVGLDTETTGLDPLTDRVRLLQVALNDDAAVIDVFRLPDPTADLAPLFAALRGKEVVGHNLQFDLRFLSPLGFVPGRVFCTLLASKVLHAGDREEEHNVRFKHGLGDVAERELGVSLDKGEQASNWTGTLTREQLAYAAADAAVLVRLATDLKAKLAATDLAATAEIEMRALPGIAWARPIAVDAKAWLAIADGAEAERARLAEEMDRLAPNPAGIPGMETTNWDSPEQVKEAFARVGVTLDSTDDDALAGVSHPLAGLLREYRGTTKRAGTYGREWVAKHAARGEVLPSWNQLGAESGRMSCSNPNLQQIPRTADYRRCFVARPGRMLVKADYSQVELRIGAKVANESVMIAAYREGRDLHSLTAARVLGKPEAEVTKADRQLAKAVNFGLLYGMGWRGLKQYAKANYGVELSDRQAQGYRTAFFKAYPALQAWHERTEAHVKKLFRADPEGLHAVYTLAGRRRFLPIAKKDGTGKPYPNKTDALNTPVQGTGADGLKVAVALLWERRGECPGAVPVIFAHDEIVLEAPADAAERAADWLRHCMVEAVAPLIDPVPVEVGVTVGPTWAGAEKPAAAKAA